MLKNCPARIHRELLDEARENLREAVGLIIEANREIGRDLNIPLP